MAFPKWRPGTGAGARRGILIKNGEALERARKIDVVMLDKTGTLTEGRPKVTEVIALQPEIALDTVLRLAASLERLSEHPLGQAVVRAAQEKNLTTESVEGFANVAGLGIKGRIDNNAVLVGNARHVSDEGIELGEAAAADRSPSGDGGNGRGRDAKWRGHRSH